MNIFNPKQILPLLLICFGMTNPAYAVKLYSNDFETPVNFVPSEPGGIMGIARVFADVYGPGNNFETTTAASHSGTSSLKFNYNGRNGMCNLCGFTSVTQKSGLTDLQSFVTDNGDDLTMDPYLAAPGKIIINRDNGFSKWEVVSVGNHSAVNDKLTLKKLFDGINSGDPAEFNDGDTVFIARQCGVDGNAVKNNVSRRTDCNKVISYIYPAKDRTTGQSLVQTPGQSLFRRIYLKAEIASDDSLIKLRYWTPISGGNTYLVAGTSKGVTSLRVEGFKNFGGSGIYKPGFGLPADAVFDRGKWYYIEEEFKAATLDPADSTGKTYLANGEYRLWFAKAGSAKEDVNALPMLDVSGLTLPPLDKTSLWGNIPHTLHTIGAWYIDDFEIADARIGPLLLLNPDDDTPPSERPAVKPGR